MASSVQALVLSDTHNNSFPDPHTIPTVDVVLHCGDITMAGGLSNYRSAMASLGEVNAELKLVIAGNHDLELDRSWWLDNLDENDDPEESSKALEIMRSGQDRNIHYLEEGVHRFTLQSGVTFSVYASAYTPEFNGYAFSYGRDEDRFTGHNTKHPIPSGVDIVMTHGPPTIPSSFRISGSTKYLLDTNTKQEHLGCPHLWQAVQRSKPLLHCFGHIHEGYGAQSLKWAGEGNSILSDAPYQSFPHYRCIEQRPQPGDQTLMVNAAIMNHDGNNNVPWIVELDFDEQPVCNYALDAAISPS
ncbi:hypothetical protein PG989_010248 [Apiospora arundinis]